MKQPRTRKRGRKKQLLCRMRRRFMVPPRKGQSPEDDAADYGICPRESLKECCTASVNFAEWNGSYESFHFADASVYVFFVECQSQKSQTSLECCRPWEKGSLYNINNRPYRLSTFKSSVSAGLRPYI